MPSDFLSSEQKRLSDLLAPLEEPLRRGLDGVYSLGVPGKADRIEVWVPLDAPTYLIVQYGDETPTPDRASLDAALHEVNTALKAAEDSLRAPGGLDSDLRRPWRRVRDLAVAEWLRRGLDASAFAR